MKGRLLAAALLAATTATAAMPARADDQALFVVVTSPDAQTQAMAMILAGEAAKKQVPVRMLLCGPGGDLALKGNAAPAMKPSGKTPQQMMQGLIQGGAKVELCALYLPNSGGKTEADLVEGVTPTRPPVVAEYMLKPNVRYFTF
ncbi:MAG TPA: DsrE family protein [Azospirillum sp.]|nr:DsrE family protein [Azospirillum sp.]